MKGRRFAGLGQVPGELVSPQSYCGSKCNAAFVNELANAIQNRLLQWPPLPANANCSGVPPSSTAAKVTSYASAAAGATASIAAIPAIAAALPLLGPAAIVAAPILLVLGTIFANHQKAVQLQSNVLCENVPAANAALQQIDAGLAAGTITPSQAANGYQQMLASFQAAMKSDPSFKTGDALWGYNQELQAVIAQRTLDLQNQYGSSVSAGAASSSTGLPSWAPLAAIAALAYFLL
jgi:hypothetical protein